MFENEKIPVLPWSSHKQWLEANQAVDYLITRHAENIKKAENLAIDIKNLLESIFPLFDELCADTCQFCPDPCCNVATVWIDFKDLLFLHLSKQLIPPHQLIRNPEMPCCYLRNRGCRLPRISRPWTCSLYLCPAQTSRLRKKDITVQKFFNKTILNVKAKRNEMEDEFIRVLA